jgi:hypothetical protein
LSTLPGVTLHYDDLVTDEDSLAAAFAALYPEVGLGPVRYRNEVFDQEHRRQFARRAAPRYKELARMVDAMPGPTTMPSSG